MKKLSLLLLTASLSACGGGGESESSRGSSQNTSYPVNKAVQTIYTTKKSYNANSDIGYSFKLVINPVSDQQYKGKTYKVSESISSLRKDGVALANGYRKSFYTINPFQFVASTENKAGNYLEVTSLTPIPQSAKIGDSGASHVANIYENNVKVGTSTATWELKESSGSNAIFCQLASDKYSTESKNTTEEDCFEIDTNGNPTGKFTASVAQGGRVITFK